MNDGSSLKNKICFVTGAGGGIGRASVEALLAAGAKVFAMSRSAKPLQSLKEDHPGAPCVTFTGSVGEEAAVADAFTACRRTFGPVDVLLNNAGVGFPSPDLAEADVASFDIMSQTNFRGVFLCTQQALRDMKPRKAGQILNVISAGGYRTNAGAPLYCASKFAARGFSNGLADQVTKLGIRVTDINPGPVDTGYWGERQVPREKFLKPEDVAAVVLFVLTLPSRVVMREIHFDSLQWLSQ